MGTVQQRVLAANVVRSSFVDVDDPADLGLVPLISSGPPEPRPGAKLSEAKTTETSEKKGHLWNTAGAEQEHRGGEDSNVRGSGGVGGREGGLTSQRRHAAPRINGVPLGEESPIAPMEVFHLGRTAVKSADVMCGKEAAFPRSGKAIRDGEGAGGVGQSSNPAAEK